MDAEREEWIQACDAADLHEDAPHLVQREGEPICLFKLGDGIFATHDTCTHGLASLADGYIDDGAIECPLHQGAFDIRTGTPVAMPCVKALATYPVKVENGKVFLGPGRPPVP